MAIGKSYEVKFENNTDKVNTEWKIKKSKMLYALGLFFQSTITKVITRNQQVLTGRLRASITFITSTKQVKPLYNSKESQSKDYITGSASENELIIGTNVIYAANVELNSKKGMFLKPGIVNYREDAKNIVESIMKE